MDVSLTARALTGAGMGLAIVAGCFTASPARAKAPKRDVAWVRSQLERWAPGGEGAPPYRLRARLELVGNDGTTVPGVYERHWVSSSQWREEIRIADYKDSVGVDGERSWSERTLPFRPWHARLAADVFDLWLPARVSRPLEFRRLRAQDGRPEMACAGFGPLRLCVDAQTGAPVLREQPPYRVRQEYGAPKPFELGSWPSEVRLIDADREIGRLVVEKLEPLPAADLARFGPPAGARVEEECPGLKWPVLVPSSKARPAYPQHLAQKRISGYVVFEATIDVDGSVTELHALRASHPDFVRPARDAITRWQYVPARCSGRPIEAHLQIVIDFDA